MAIDPIIGSSLISTGAGVLGMIGQDARARKQHQRQRELMGLQFDNQRALNEHGQKLQMQTWRDTGYPAQMKMMKEAGLNPALMYGMSGGGGQTTGSQGGGSAASGQAHAPMDIGAIAQVGKMLAETAKLNAETKNIEGDTDKKDAEVKQIASNIRNMDANTSRTNQIKEFEKYEQDMKKKGIYPNDGKFWRMLSNNISEEDIKKLTEAFVGTLKTPLNMLSKFGEGVEYFMEWILKKSGIEFNLSFDKNENKKNKNL